MVKIASNSRHQLRAATPNPMMPYDRTGSVAKLVTMLVVHMVYSRLAHFMYMYMYM